MVTYSCEKCNKIFILKGDYTRHMERKFPCIKDESRCIQVIPQISSALPQKSSKSSEELETDEEVKKDDNPIKCYYCKKEYTRRDNLKRHEEYYCKKKKEERLKEENNLKIIEEYNKTIEEQRKLIERLSKRSKIENINNGTINNGTINNTNIVVQFKDDSNLKRFLTEVEKMYIMNKGGLAPNQAFKTLYYNPKRPELHNAYASDTKCNKMMIYDGKTFKISNYKETLQTMINNSIDCIEQIYEEIEETEDDMNKYRYVKKLLDKLNNNQNAKERQSTMEMIVSELKNEPYNCRELILQTHKGMSIITI